MCPQEADLIVRHALLVTQDDLRASIPDGALAVAGGRIVACAPTAEVDAAWVSPDVIDGDGAVCMPGMANIHTHLFQSAVKGMGEDLAVEKWVQAVTFPTAQALTPDDAYLLALVSCLDNLRSGATTVMDFMYPLADPALHEAVIQAMLDSGLRSIYTRCMNDAGADVGVLPALIAPAEKTLAHACALQRTYDGAGNGRMRIGIAIGSVWGSTEPGLRAVRRVANETGMLVTMHVNESSFDDFHTRRRFGMGTIPLLKETGLLGPDFVAVHCVHMSDEDIALFAGHGVSVAYNAVSNMYLGSGIAPVVRFMREGIPVGVSADGSGSNNCQDMLEVLKISALLQKVAAQDAGVVRAQDSFDWATRGGARCLRMENEIGSLEVGKRADFFLLDAFSAKAVPVHDPVATLVYSCGQQNVRDVVVDGRVLLRNGNFVHLDEGAILRRTQAAAQALAARSGTERLLETRPIWRPV
jgi:5-methylthioadenosine/S-adenosylhomocysteine deaminase